MIFHSFLQHVTQNSFDILFRRYSLESCLCKFAKTCKNYQKLSLQGTIWKRCCCYSL
jgi:hypothetical protein